MFYITNDTRRFNSLESAQLALTLSIEGLYLTAQLLDHPYSTPNWCIFNDEGRILQWADGTIPDADNAN